MGKLTAQQFPLLNKNLLGPRPVTTIKLAGNFVSVLCTCLCPDSLEVKTVIVKRGV